MDTNAPLLIDSDADMRTCCAGFLWFAVETAAILAALQEAQRDQREQEKADRERS